MAYWQAYITLDSDEVSAISRIAAESLPAERFGIVTEVLKDGSDGAVQLALDVEASSLAGAMEIIEVEWEKLRADGGLARATADVDFVVGPINEPALRHQMLLGRARSLLQATQPTYAVVVAQTAFEIYIRGLLRDLSRAVMPTGVADVVQPRSASLRDAAGRKLFEVLVGKLVVEAGSRWTEYESHVRRRNGVVHEGAEFDEDAATSSIRAVEELIAWIDAAVGEHQ